MAISTRLRTTADEERVLDAAAAHLGCLRRADLAAVSQPNPVDPGLDAQERRELRRRRLNARKKELTAQSSARWANAIIAANDDQYRLARDTQYRHMIGLRAAIATIDKRVAAPTTDMLTVSERSARRTVKAVKGYATQAERFAKQRRVQHLRAKLARVEQDRAAGRARVVEVVNAWPGHAVTSTGNRPLSRMRGTESRPPDQNVRGDPGRATVTPASANNGQLRT